jgi:hypothetical protein
MLKKNISVETIIILADNEAVIHNSARNVHRKATPIGARILSHDRKTIDGAWIGNWIY